MDSNYIDVMSQLMACISEPLGDYAPKRRDFIVGFEDSSGCDCTQEMTAWVPGGTASEEIAQTLREYVEDTGNTVAFILERDGDAMLVHYATQKALGVETT